MFEAPDRRRQPDNDLNLLQIAKSPPPATDQRRRALGRGSRWQWLLLVAVVMFARNGLVDARLLWQRMREART